MFALPRFALYTGKRYGCIIQVTSVGVSQYSPPLISLHEYKCPPAFLRRLNCSLCYVKLLGSQKKYVKKAHEVTTPLDPDACGIVYGLMSRRPTTWSQQLMHKRVFTKLTSTLIKDHPNKGPGGAYPSQSSVKTTG